MSPDRPADEVPGEHAHPWSEALRYPLQPPALATNLVLSGFRVVAAILPVWGVPLHWLIWLWLYKYGLEALTASAEGRDDAPEGWSSVERGLHASHYWLQMLVLVALLAATRLAPPEWQAWLVAALALLLPGAVLSLAMAHNLLAALNPLNWLRIALRLRTGYLSLAVFAGLVLWMQAKGGEWLADAPLPLLAIPLFYLVAHHLTLSLFRLMGMAWRRHADAFEVEQEPVERRTAQLGRHENLMRAEALSDPLEDNPARRAAQLARLLARGAPEDLHREYRLCLRAAGDLDGRVAHARTHACELLALGQTQAAVALIVEGLEEAPDFALPDAASTGEVMAAATRLGLHRQAAKLGANYRAAHPRRYDGLPLALKAATLLANRLDEPAPALALLRAAQPMTEAGIDREAFDRAIDDLQQGRAIGETR